MCLCVSMLSAVDVSTLALDLNSTYLLFAKPALVWIILPLNSSYRLSKYLPRLWVRPFFPLQPRLVQPRNFLALVSSLTELNLILAGSAAGALLVQTENLSPQRPLS